MVYPVSINNLCGEPSEDQREAWARSGTPRNGYVKIEIVRPTAERPNGYLGAQSSYDPMPGEDHRRGNDLPDGGFTEETIDRICAALKEIVRGQRS